MSVVLDTTFALALYGRRDPHHARAAAWYRSTDEDLVATPLVVAELDRRLPEAARPPWWEDLDGAWAVRWWADGMRDTLAVVREHPALGLTRASLVALTRVLRTTRIATFDDGFRSLTTPDGQPLQLLPDREDRPA